MCLSIPGKIITIDGEYAEVSVGGSIFRAGLQMVDNVKPGDYVLLHTGFAIQKLTEEEARESLKIFEEFNELNIQLDEEERKTGKRIT